MEEQAFTYLLHRALKVIYFPHFFFKEEIFKLEEEYTEFQYDFMSFMGPEALYMSYLIFKKEGTEKVFDNLQNFVINRYILKPIIGPDVISLLSAFIDFGFFIRNFMF